MDQKRQNIAWNTSGQQNKLLQLRNTDQIAIIISIRRGKNKAHASNELHQQGRKRNHVNKKTEREKGRWRAHYSSCREQVFIRDLNIGNQRPYDLILLQYFLHHLKHNIVAAHPTFLTSLPTFENLLRDTLGSKATHQRTSHTQNSHNKYIQKQKKQINNTPVQTTTSNKPTKTTTSADATKGGDRRIQYDAAIRRRLREL
jgi:hypothetical protein